MKTTLPTILILALGFISAVDGDCQDEGLGQPVAASATKGPDIVCNGGIIKILPIDWLNLTVTACPTVIITNPAYTPKMTKPGFNVANPTVKQGTLVTYDCKTNFVGPFPWSQHCSQLSSVAFGAYNHYTKESTCKKSDSDDNEEGDK